MSLQGKVINSAQITVDLAELRRSNIAVDQFMVFATKFKEVDVVFDCDKITIIADSLWNLVKFEKKFKEMCAECEQYSTPISEDQLSLSTFANIQTPQIDASNIDTVGASGLEADSLSIEQVFTPFRQPHDGYTVSENVNEQQGPGLLKRKFCFPKGEIKISGDIIKYSSFECVINVPQKPVGFEVDALLKEAFMRRKLFYIRRDIYGSGFAIQSAYQLLPSNKSEETISGSKLLQMREKLYDLGAELSEDPSDAVTPESSSVDGVIAPEQHIDMRRPEAGVKSTMKSVTLKPLQSPSVHEPALSMDKSLRFSQPDGLVLNSEFHRKDLKGFEGVGAIHMYFRFDGGKVSNAFGETVQYPSYNKTACLPGNSEGRRLYGMIEKGAKSKKLFVVAYKGGEFKLRSKIRLLNSDDYPQDSYLQLLFEEMLKLQIQPLSSIPPLPTKIQAHHGESSDDEKEDEKLEELKKGGPFEQPEKGMMIFEKDSRKLNGFAACDAIMVSVRFAGGKMIIKGYKPSKSFEIQYSQAHIAAALPGNDQGKRIAAMLHKAFQRRQLFNVEKRDGEPSFRVRPKVHLITAEEYPKNGYLMRLTRQLQNLGIPEPTERDIADLIFRDSKSMHQGAAVPPLITPVLQPRPLPSPRNTGARPKQTRFQRIKVQTTQTVQQGASSYSAPGGITADSCKSKDDEDKCPICLGPLTQMPCKKLQCGHEFHQGCVDMALKAQPNNCPYCKQPVTLNSASVPIGFQASPLTRATTPVTPPPFYLNTIFGNHAYSNLHNGNWGISTNQQSLPQHFATNNTSSKLTGVMNSSIDMRSLPGYEGSNTIVIDYRIPPGIQQNGHLNPGQRYDGTNRQAYLPDNSEGRDLLRLLKRAFDSGHTFTIGRSQTTGRDNQVIWNGIPHKTNIRGGKQSFGYPDKDYLNELRRTLSSKGIQ